jgi:hypothetical protein
MPLNFIPNQPFLFEQALPDQPCLNNDPNVYTQMVTADDTICVQQILTPCLEDVLCDPNMYELGADILAGAWDGFGGWTSADVNHVEYDGASYSINEFTFLDITPTVVGAVYKISFEITSITGACATNGVTLAINGAAANGLPILNATGTYDAYFINSQNPSQIVFVFIGFVPTVGDTIAITVNSFQQVTDDCWVADYTDWTYSYDATTGQGKYCSIVTLDGDLVNTSAYANDLNYHRVTLTITDSTAGGLEVILGGVYLGTTTGNGEFTFYGIPTDSSLELILRKVDSFDGCVSLVDVDDFGFFDTLDPGDSICQLTVVNTAQTQESSVIAFELWDDRIIWCFNTSILQSELSPIEMDCNDTYQLKILYACDFEVIYISTTAFRWNASGWDCTFIMSAYSDGYAFGFYFGSVTAPLFYLTQRLRILQFAPKYPAVGEEYLYSNGSFSRSFAQSGKVRQAWFDYVDETCHDVIRLQVLSDVLTLDSDVYFAPLKDYEPEWDEHRYNLAQSRIDLVKEETLFNRSCFSIGQAPCTTNVVTIPPSTTIGYEMIGEFDLTNVNPANFSMNVCIQSFFATASSNDATTLAGRNAILAYMSSFITSTSFGLSGTIINTSVTYVAPILDITIIGTGNYNSTYSAASFEVDGLNYNGNVIMLQPQ